MSGGTFRVRSSDTEPGLRWFSISDDDILRQWWDEDGCPELLAVFRQFGIAAFQRSSSALGLDAFIRRNNLGGDHCLEIGSYRGLTSVVLSRHFRKVTSLDIVDQPIKREIVQFLGIDNIEFIQISDNDEKARIIKSLPVFDAAYIDGDHAHDSESDFELVKRCRRVLFHEYWPLQPPVWNLVNRLRKVGTVTRFSNFALWIDGNG